MSSVVPDMRFAVRGLRRSPGFALTAVATLAIGIGVNAAVFTVTKAALFAGSPMVRENDRILYLTTTRYCCVSYPDFEDWRAQAKSFQGMAMVEGLQKTLTDHSGFPEIYSVTDVSANTFRLVGQQPILGRDFTASDESPGAAPVAILSYGFWERRYGRDAGIIGQTVRVNEIATTVIGVMPRGFSFPETQDFWMPMVRTPQRSKRDNRESWFVFGRLANGANIQSARTEMATIGKRLEAAYPQTDRGIVPEVRSFRDFFLDPNETLLYVSMLGAVAFVLLIACANLANLMLARAIGRAREISIRIALGAGRWRIIRQLLLESALLSTLGGFLGWWIAKWAVRAYELTPTRSTWRVLDYSMDYRVLAYLVAISIVTAILFGLAPAVRLSKLDVHAIVKAGGQGATGGRGGNRLSALLVTGETALAVILLAGAGLMIRSFWNIYSANIGVDATNVLAAELELPQAKYPDARAQNSFVDRLKMRLETVPGVESMSMASGLPTGRAMQLPYELPDASAAVVGKGARRPTVSAVTVGSDYFRTLGATVLSGREFITFDGPTGIPAVIVNQRFATEHWPGENPLGERLRVYDGDKPDAWRTVVGVVSNIAQDDFTRQSFDPLIYLPYEQTPPHAGTVPARYVWIIARTRVAPESLGNSFRRAAQAVDSGVPVLTLAGLPGILASNYRDTAKDAVLFLIFAAIAVLLASVGLYAVIAHSVSRRTQEIGIRMAVGATARDILKLVFLQGMVPLGVGLTIGLAASLAVDRVLKSELVNVSPSDPLTLIVAATVLILAAMLGCWIPARRAMRVDPMEALRHE